ncbi:cadherin-1 [Hypomesus transpacificus]|uniref:cadherin-1 n=1 Tax=Hypomesus transpacificus TaxID=137520 RepID=UPI001F07DEC6|nr:cadherin-1 [Hypomesus transpacificus]
MLSMMATFSFCTLTVVMFFSQFSVARAAEINILENAIGPLPRRIVQIRSDSDKEAPVQYQIQGPGADQPPEKLFTIDRNTGWLYVTKLLDREKQDKYTLKAIVKTGDAPAEAPMDIIINVIDMNDNKPVFPPEPFRGNVPEASSTGFEFMKVEATDADEPGNANSEIFYTILSQDPPLPNANMFDINPASGQIRVQSQGLDREKYPKYTLKVQAADMKGYGLIGMGEAIITVTDSNDNAPQFEQPTAPTGLKKPCIISPFNFPENDRGPFPKMMLQIWSDSDKEATRQYQIEGPGADQPPEKLFTINRNTGWLYVTKPLDREKQDKYTLKVFAKIRNRPAEAPMDIIINVIDQNDNKPVFPPEPFLGNIPEASSTGFEFMKVEATDADEPGNDNSEIRYKILSQDPPLPNPSMFAINPVSGHIRVQSQGLDKEKYPRYTLEVEAADMEGEGLTGRGKAIITVQ